MRQAGRYMPEYQVLRKKHGFMELCHQPELAEEVTMQPIDAFGVDAAILFSDILVTAEALGFDVDIVESKGPVIANPVKTAADVAKLASADNAMQNLGYIEQILKSLSARLSGKKALLGFAGAPLTVASYAIEGGSSKTLAETFKMINQEPKLFDALMEKFTELTASYIRMQVNAGADAVQIFESWARMLPADLYRERVWPHLQRLVEQCSDLPILFFAQADTELWEDFFTLPVLGFSVGTEIRLRNFKKAYANKLVQGNMDPRWMTLSPELAVAETQRLLEDSRGLTGHIFNLAHGLLPITRTETVQAVVDCVKRWKV